MIIFTNVRKSIDYKGFITQNVHPAGNANQKPFERIMIMEYELTGIGKIKMTVGVRRRTLEKIQYCITAISSE